MADLRDEERSHVDTPTNLCMYNPSDIIECFEVYTVGERQKKDPTVAPFVQIVNLRGLGNEPQAVRATFDDGAMVSVIDTTAFSGMQHKLAGLQSSKRVLRMANGVLVLSGGTWSGTVIVGNVSVERTFEIFPSGGA